ncbi:unnamed protein product [Effrenium voratum]|uniref:Uncharacterized protein n=1 Tax=Effrenium voratum TaxID=2562239 RepID=A0AA36MXR1_9DINO|nr:unnamed protein product [Effrenium voratum]CAJ1433393.1 unnamed protein product [Effrenium voratum]
MGVSIFASCLSDQCRPGAAQVAPQNDEVIQVDFSQIKVSPFQEEDADSAPRLDTQLSA